MRVCLDDVWHSERSTRRATCYLQIAKPHIAIADFKKVLAFEPKNETVRAQLTATQKLVRKIEFEKVDSPFLKTLSYADVVSIPGDRDGRREECSRSLPGDYCGGFVRCPLIHGRLIIERCPGGCEVESDYTGPVLHRTEDGKFSITQAFIIKMIDWFKQGKKLPRRYAWEIVLGAHTQLTEEESLVQLNLDEGETCDVIGDVHGISKSLKRLVDESHLSLVGQLYDLLHLYSLTGPPRDDHYLLMNGDLVDRGSWSMEVILIAFAYKCKCKVVDAASTTI